MEKVFRFLRQRIFFVVGVLILILAVGGFFLWPEINSWQALQSPISDRKRFSVQAPSIVDGELVLPKVVSNGLLNSKSKVKVLSAFLVGVFDSSGALGNEGTPKLVGIRILGEVANESVEFVNEVSPVIRFLDGEGKLISQKVGRVTPGFSFFGISPGEKTVYDFLVEDPPQADKLEIIVNSKGFSKKANFERLKVVDSKIEVKTASVGGSLSPEASLSGLATLSATPALMLDSEIEYYTLSGSFQNNLVDPVTDVTVYSWVKNSEGKVFSFAKQEFKGDLVAPKKKLKFKTSLLPFRDFEKMATYGVAVFAKRYKL